MNKKLNDKEIKKITRNVPPTRYPLKIEQWYERQLKKLVKSWQTIAQSIVDVYISKNIKGGNVFLKDDNFTGYPSWIESLSLYFAIMKSTIEHSQSDVYLDNLTKQFVKSVDSFSFNNVKVQAKIAGIDPIKSNKETAAYVKTRIQENTSLIKSMRNDYIDKLQNDIYESITSGDGVTGLTKNIVKRTNMSLKHASLIANDQTGSIISDLDSYRAKTAGAKSYIWQSVEDQRVRPKHQELNQTEQQYDDPNGGDNGQRPGQPIRCRCVALPIF
ncbi:SPP1 gp7 family putative phage head morphogenesis protein [Lactobacillus colini]|uniref:SPP1 gp7 family putative phage head morphogenesis protein n=1 Tax=Lactobacillus colini TaxID=1819254 RepID=A0ABS4MEX1_9LACO|nr:phage minor head protein [Lactobacillus colini]MBP2057886.1 SPP1 gp7 family putative phage head morphogenesis protein [Lactobacillus colini]